MQISWSYTIAGYSPYDGVRFRTLHGVAVVWGDVRLDAFDRIEVPADWSEAASEALISGALHRSGVPTCTTAVAEQDVPPWLWRQIPHREALSALPAEQREGAETSAKQVFDRLAGAWTYWGWKCGYFDTEADAQAFFDEVRYMLCRGIAAPDGPQWRETGLYWAYGLEAERPERHCVEYSTGQARQTRSCEHPLSSSTAIHGLRRSPEEVSAVIDLWAREARVLGNGGSVGCNVSAVRGKDENAAGEISAPGLVRLLEIGDTAAAAATRQGEVKRLARMVAVNADHPDIEAFIEWKSSEEFKAAALTSGSRLAERHFQALRHACRSGPEDCRLSDHQFDPAQNPALNRAMAAAREAMIPEPAIRRVIALALQGHWNNPAPSFDTDWDGPGFAALSAQSAIHAVRVNNDFVGRVAADAPWRLTRRSDASIERIVDARALWDRIGRAAWAPGELSLQFDTTVNEWHTCPEDGRIAAASPAGDFHFLDDTALMRANLNASAFIEPDGAFAVDSFLCAVRLWTVTLDIAVTMAGHADAVLARGTYAYRPIGLGVSNLAGLLLAQGCAYDGDDGRTLGAAVTALMTGTAYAASAEIRGEMGAFPAFQRNREAMARVLRNHRRAAKGEKGGFEGLTQPPTSIKGASVRGQPGLMEAVVRAWDQAIALGSEHGYRNAQMSSISPASIAERLMDCDSAGIEPIAALIGYEKLPDGGFVKIVNRNIPKALKVLGYADDRIKDILRYILGRGTLADAPGVNHQNLRRLGFNETALQAIEAALPSALDIRFVFNKWTVGEKICTRVLGFGEDVLEDVGFDMLKALGFDEAEIARANAYCCGAATMKGYPASRPGAPSGVRLRQCGQGAWRIKYRNGDFD